MVEKMSFEYRLRRIREFRNERLVEVAARAGKAALVGEDFEGARFLNSSGSIVFTQTTGTGASGWEAFQQPRASE